MIRVYFLEVEKKNNTEFCKGSQYIHNAILDCTEKPNIRKLIQDTTDSEHNGLIKIAQSWREATEDEIESLQSSPSFPVREPARDLAKEIDLMKADIVKLKAGKVDKV